MVFNLSWIIFYINYWMTYEKIELKFQIFVRNFLLNWIRRLTISFIINKWSSQRIHSMNCWFNFKIVYRGWYKGVISRAGFEISFWQEKKNLKWVEEKKISVSILIRTSFWRPIENRYKGISKSYFELTESWWFFWSRVSLESAYSMLHTD